MSNELLRHFLWLWDRECKYIIAVRYQLTDIYRCELMITYCSYQTEWMTHHQSNRFVRSKHTNGIQSSFITLVYRIQSRDGFNHNSIEQFSQRKQFHTYVFIVCDRNQMHLGHFRNFSGVDVYIFYQLVDNILIHKHSHIQIRNAWGWGMWGDWTWKITCDNDFVYISHINIYESNIESKFMRCLCFVG